LIKTFDGYGSSQGCLPHVHYHLLVLPMQWPLGELLEHCELVLRLDLRDRLLEQPLVLMNLC
jgi:hypothetical protein